MAQLQPLVQRGVLEVTNQDGRTVIGMRANVLFPSGSADLSPQGRETVTEVGRILAKKTSLDWQVEGHTDNQPISSEAYPDNWYLGASRAIAVLEVMVRAGMPGDHVSAATFGQFAPIASNSTDTGGRRTGASRSCCCPRSRSAPGRRRARDATRHPRQRMPGRVSQESEDARQRVLRRMERAASRMPARPGVRRSRTRDRGGAFGEACCEVTHVHGWLVESLAGYPRRRRGGTVSWVRSVRHASYIPSISAR
ncbi:MAG: OmpA family protein [Myxococcota bacterium]